MTTIKNLLYIPAFILGLEFQAVAILFFFILFDIITGIIKSARIKGVKSIKSSTMAYGLIYKLLILLVPIIISAIGMGVGVDLLFLAKGSMSVFILAEGYSILGNMVAIKTGEEVEEFDAITLSINKTREVIKNLIERQ